MTKILWDKVGERFYEAGVDHGVLYRRDVAGAYVHGYAWNGLTTVTESPSGAEASAQYADNLKYLNLVSAEEFGATVEAFTSPKEFDECDGTATPVTGVSFGQQTRKSFGLSYRTLVGNDVTGTDYGYKLHLVYGAMAAPSERARATINESPEATALSWELTTTPTDVGTVGGVKYKPTAHVSVESSQVNAAALATLEDILYGTPGVDPRLPTPAEVYALFAATVTEVVPGVPTYVSGTHTLTIPATANVTYQIDGVTQTAGAQVITKDTVVTATPNVGYKFPPVTDDDWYFDFV